MILHAGKAKIYNFCKFECMQASELRIGNIIRAKGLHEDKILTVEHIGEKGTFIDDYRVIKFKEHSTGEFVKDCEGIALAPEILEACGFVNAEKGYLIWSDGEMDIHMYDDSLKFRLDKYNGNRTQIKYLHQFQNIYYSLTGRELEIKLT
jgi:hypothetical protein